MGKQQVDLLKRLKGGEEAAVKEWFVLFEPKLTRFVLTKIGNRKDAEEIVQDTFLNCLKHLPLFRGESSLQTWMWRIASHEIADYYRKKYAKKVLQTIPLFEQILQLPLEDAHETSQKVRQVLQQLGKQKAELLKLKYIDKKRVQEIAKELGKTAKAVESDLFRTRVEFRRVYLEVD